MDISDSSVSIRNLDSEKSELNELPLSETPVIEKGLSTCIKPKKDLKDVSGGYLIEMDSYYFFDKPSHFYSKKKVFYSLKSPRYASQKELNYISGFVDKAEQSIMAKSEKSYLKYIDVDSWAKMNVIQEILANCDFMRSSQYFYKLQNDASEPSGLLYAGPIWDMELTLGNDRDYVSEKTFLTPSCRLVSDLYQKQTYRDSLTDVYENICRPFFKEMLKSGIDNKVETIRASVENNDIIWPEGSDSFYRKRGFTEDVEYIKDYLRCRLELFDSLWIDGVKFIYVKEAPCLMETGMTFYTRYLLVQQGKALGNIRDSFRPEYVFEGWYYGTPEKSKGEFDPDAPVEEEISIFAGYSKKQP